MAVNTTTNEALQHITAYWRQIWRRPLPDHVHASNTTKHLGPPRAPAEWEPFSPDDLYTKQKAHKAPGVDCWYGSDIALIPRHGLHGLTDIFTT